MNQTTLFSQIKIFAALLLCALAACNLPVDLQTPVPSQPLPVLQSPQPTGEIATPQVFAPGIEITPPTATSLPEVEPTPLPPTEQPQITPSEPPPSRPGATLAFLNNGDLWLANVPDGVLTQLTYNAGLYSFAWAPDGSILATFNGRQLCAVTPSGEPYRTCIDLGLNEDQAAIPRQIAIAPDQRYIVLWNTLNPWDETALGWIIVYRDGSGSILNIADPVDWGMTAAPNNEPGGITGQPIFLPDGTLLGALSHRWLCISNGCHYQLFSFDLEQKLFSPFPNRADEGFSEGPRLLLSSDQRLLGNYGAFTATCDTAISYFDLYDLASGGRFLFGLENENLQSVSLSPDSNQAVLGRSAACSQAESGSWDRACGLSQGFDLFSMQILDIASGHRSDLAPGTDPIWSPNGAWIAFRSCLAQNASSGWETSPSGIPSIYIIAPDGFGLQMISPGSLPAWSPIP
jgi:hypothetical protein